MFVRRLRDRLAGPAPDRPRAGRRQVDRARGPFGRPAGRLPGRARAGRPPESHRRTGRRRTTRSSSTWTSTVEDLDAGPRRRCWSSARSRWTAEDRCAELPRLRRPGRGTPFCLCASLRPRSWDAHGRRGPVSRSVVVDCPEPRRAGASTRRSGAACPRRRTRTGWSSRFPRGPRLGLPAGARLRPPDGRRADHGAQQFHLDFDAGAHLGGDATPSRRRWRWARGRWTGRTRRGEGLPGVRRSGRASVLPLPDRAAVGVGPSQP
ncbi:hypothetical protein SHIRM173S_00953 [Streptomyces hirsutus]